MSHIVLKQCKNLDLLLDITNLDPIQYDITDLSFEYTPYLKLEFNQPRQSSLKLVVQNSIKTTLKGTLEENQNNIQMFFRNVGGSRDNYRLSEVIFQNFFSRSSIDLLNFINIGNIIVDGSSIQNVDNFEIRDREITRDPTNCYKIADDGLTRVEVNCTRQELFYDNIRSKYSVFSLSKNHALYHPLMSRPPLPVPSPIDKPEFIVPIVLLVAVVLIILSVVLFIKVKK